MGSSFLDPTANHHPKASRCVSSPSTQRTERPLRPGGLLFSGPTGEGNVPPRIPKDRSALRSGQVEEFGAATGGGVWGAAGDQRRAVPSGPGSPRSDRPWPGLVGESPTPRRSRDKGDPCNPPGEPAMPPGTGVRQCRRGPGLGCCVGCDRGDRSNRCDRRTGADRFERRVNLARPLVALRRLPGQAPLDHRPQCARNTRRQRERGFAQDPGCQFKRGPALERQRTTGHLEEEHAQ